MTSVRPRSASSKAVPEHSDIRSHISWSSVEVISDLSSNLIDLLADDDLSTSMESLLSHGELLYEGLGAASAIIRISDDIIVKIVNKESASTELSSLLYLKEHLPSFPAPRPYGLIQTGPFYLLFSTLIPGSDLERIWAGLDHAEKMSISAQVEELLTKLRSLPWPDGNSLGAVDGQGCKDARRFIRTSDRPITNVEQFQDFVFSGSTTASSLYIGLLRDLRPTATDIVFTHGDVRPANIIVEQGEDGKWKVAALVDWEFSGFYPAYWESVKMTNNMVPSSSNEFDWYRYLPKRFLEQYSVEWLVDRLWDQSMAHS